MKRSRDELRKLNYKHINHKKYICKHAYGFDWYPDNQSNRYSKGKIHCSCPICRFKSLDYGNNSRKQRTISDYRKLVEIENKEKEYEEE